ncbi:hypothetical protein Hypma_004220 [Hypsizygus marmoreus]|uniref:Protein kinase domain-containing protein n=1 Tax=Hypsizygus marmoreus TaxID=39966 RepID=A0A369J0G7_HYPMA|nr:hypothetical protein Hypma_004220 [Hypsizygus marmoreus]
MTCISSITLLELASSSSSPADITLYRTESFPGCRYSDTVKDIPPISNWVAEPPPKNTFDIRLRLGEQISEGRIGLVYSVDVLEIVKPATDLFPPPPDLPRELCVKIVKKPYGRSLAREAWFYEQLARVEGCAGVSTPRCFGFFATSLNGCLDYAGNPVTDVKPWLESKIRPRDCNSSGDVDDVLRDDRVQKHFRDEGGTRDKSAWNKWKPSATDPLICILLLEKIGAPYINAPHFTNSEIEHLQDIRDIVYDIGYAGVCHGDLRYANVLRAPTNDTSPLCPRHQRRHNWRLVDFDRAYRLHFTDAVPLDVQKATYFQADGVGEPYFWGWI